MKKILHFGLLVLCFPTMLFAQEKVNAPVWNVGDKWIFSNKGSIEVVSAEENSYVLRFSDDIYAVESQKFNAIVIDKSTFHRIYGLEGDKRKEYTNMLRKIFDFPLSPGKQWKDEEIYQIPVASTFSMLGKFPYYEIFTVLGWEDIEVQAGKFKAIKLEVARGHPGDEPMGKSLYWYSPEAKYFVKYQELPSDIDSKAPRISWELTAFNVKK